MGALVGLCSQSPAPGLQALWLSSLMDIHGVSITLLWDQTLVESQLSRGGGGPEAQLGPRAAQSNTMWLYLVYSGAEKVSVRYVQIIEEGFCVCAASHCCPRTVAAHVTGPDSLVFMLFQWKQLLVERNFNESTFTVPRFQLNHAQ